LSKGSACIIFDRVIRNKKGSVSGIELSVYESPVACNSISGSISGKKIDVDKFPKMLGHCRSDRLENTGKIYDFKLSGKFETCEVWSIEKARQKNLNKDWKGGSEISGVRLYLDICSIKDTTYGGSKFWAFIVDNYTSYCWSIFLKSMSELKEQMLTLLTNFKIAEINVQFIPCDDSGENKSFQNVCCANGHKIKFEYLGSRILQQNGRVEWKFQTFSGRIRAILNNAGIEEGLRSGVWAECARTTTFLSNITALKSRAICPYQLMFGSKPKLPSSLKIFGEMGVITIKDDIQSKLKYQGLTCMFVGYSVDHATMFIDC
jgi:hypothetical protein